MLLKAPIQAAGSQGGGAIPKNPKAGQATIPTMPF